MLTKQRDIKSMKCQNCQHNNPQETVVCENCGTTLHNTIQVKKLSTDTLPTLDRVEFREALKAKLKERQQAASENTVAEAQPQTNLSQSEARNTDAAILTTKMPDLLQDTDIPFQIGHVRFEGGLILTEQESKTEFYISHADLEEAVIGRLNSKTGFKPIVDLTVVNGKEKGISRRHATISRKEGLIFIVDHNSLNGTFINEQKLVPEQDRVLRDTDTIRLGHINLSVSFIKKSNAVT